jgi:hypothetical protein
VFYKGWGIFRPQPDDAETKAVLQAVFAPSGRLPFALGLLAAFVVFGAGDLHAAPLLLAAEDFQFTSNWDLDSHSGTVGRDLLRSNGSALDALSMINVPEAGTYHLWTRSVDFAHNQPGARRYLVLIDGIPASKESGQHHRDGLHWEDVATMNLSAGPHVVALRDSKRAFARCDAILLAPPGFDPEPLSVAQLRSYRVAPIPIAEGIEAPATAPAPSPLRDLREVAALGTDSVRIRFQKGIDPAGRPLVLRQVWVQSDGVWRLLPLSVQDESLSFLYSPQTGINLKGYFPFWSDSQPITFTEGGKTYAASRGRDPFLAGKRVALRPVDAVRTTPQTVQVTYEGEDGSSATGTWSLDGKIQRLTVALQAVNAGYYSLVFSPFQSWKPDEADFVQLPPMFQMQRLPKTPTMVTSSETPHALALVQVGAATKSPMTYVIAADPADLRFAWATPANAAYGFSLLNREARVQPTAFSRCSACPTPRRRPEPR